MTAIGSVGASGGETHGIDSVVWDNLGNGWRFECACGYITSPSPALHESAEEIEDHWHLSGVSR